MKIYSWNILYRNKELDRAFEFIQHTDFDIFCLQEVPLAFLERLQTLPYHIAFRTDVERFLPTGVVSNYVVTLSKHPISTEGVVSFPDYWPLLPLRTRLFVHLMPSRYFSRIRNRNGQYVDITIGQETLRIFNLHLVQAHPKWRLQELETALCEVDPRKRSVVCGDFNTHSRPYTALLNWILGGKISDAFYYKRERAVVERIIRIHDLTNPLTGQVTHDFSQSQLDHILVSNSFSIKDPQVLPDRIGSDHHPISVEIS